ncbi:F-box/LRR-repeat protein-like [Dorcoceras hygrometricum]|uniref:F-box/LRR-repeat protein-like n=1 Tax=Dorcoceras hygrometricum TaxID=472368 RepID=A0A2Z7BAK8_9LAMI|nr:F-box/LRR-repeat protein-like [Dorcoceras hygrometricum]
MQRWKGDVSLSCREELSDISCREELSVLAAEMEIDVSLSCREEVTDFSCRADRSDLTVDRDYGEVTTMGSKPMFPRPVKELRSGHGSDWALIGAVQPLKGYFPLRNSRSRAPSHQSVQPTDPQSASTQSISMLSTSHQSTSAQSTSHPPLRTPPPCSPIPPNLPPCSPTPPSPTQDSPSHLQRLEERLTGVEVQLTMMWQQQANIMDVLKSLQSDMKNKSIVEDKRAWSSVITTGEVAGWTKVARMVPLSPVWKEEIGSTESTPEAEGAQVEGNQPEGSMRLGLAAFVAPTQSKVMGKNRAVD